MSPEMLTTKEFESLLSTHIFSIRVYCLGVDEPHLLHTWGDGFHKRFQQIGFIRARMPTRAVVGGLTATFAVGAATTSVIKLL